MGKEKIKILLKMLTDSEILMIRALQRGQVKEIMYNGFIVTLDNLEIIE